MTQIYFKRRDILHYRTSLYPSYMSTAKWHPFKKSEKAIGINVLDFQFKIQLEKISFLTSLWMLQGNSLHIAREVCFRKQCNCSFFTKNGCELLTLFVRYLLLATDGRRSTRLMASLTLRSAGKSSGFSLGFTRSKLNI